MKGTTLKALPLVAAMAFASGWASGQAAGNTGASAPAAQARDAQTKKDAKLSRGDRKFMQDAAGDGLFEVQVSQLAASKASNPDVKSFAGKLVDDHQKANDELVKLASAKQVELPAAPARAERSQIAKLGKMSASDLDKHYIEDVGIKDHEKDIRKFEKASKDVKDPDLKAWVDKTLPHLREHLAMARKIHDGGSPAAMGHAGTGDKTTANTNTT